MANNANLKPFKAGDKRINRRGRPKSFDALRELSLLIANETVSTATKKMGVISEKPEFKNLKVAEYIMRKWAFSNEPHLQKAFIEVAFGKVPDRVELGSDVDLIGKVVFEIIKDKNANT